MNDRRSVTVDDAQMVMWSADILEKSEFEVFEMAYQAWYRELPETRRLERLFGRYMFDGVAPFWVRQFTRATLEAHDGWRFDEATTVAEYLSNCLRDVTTAIISTSGLALSLFVPRITFPGSATELEALPA